MCFDLTIPGPPVSWKNNKTIVWQSEKPKIVPSRECGRWMRRAIAELGAQWPWAPIDEPISIRYRVVLGPRQRLDLDNALLGANDALERAGVIRNDSLIHELQAVRITTDRKNPRIEIKIDRAGA